jgi:hypothetical protein
MFSVFYFFFFKIRDQEGGTTTPRGEGWHWWEGGDVGEEG